MTFYQASLIKPKRRRRTSLEIRLLEAQIYDVLKQDHPQSVRHVFYRMTDPRLTVPIEKSQTGYDQVQHRILNMRRKRQLPYDWIVDMSRHGYHVSTYGSRGEFLRRVAELYRGDLWSNAAYYCEVWCESRSIASIIRDDCRDLAVSLYPAGGFSSDTLVYEAARQIAHLAAGRPVVVFYIGDYDPAGVHVDRDIRNKLWQHLRNLRPGDASQKLHLERLGINPDQVIRYNLPTKVRNPKDRRSLHIDRTVEAEAMPAHILRSLLRANIEALLPPRALDVMKTAEESERAFFMNLAPGGPRNCRWQKRK